MTKIYKVGTKVICNGYKGVVVENYKIPGDICIDWENGEKYSYDKEAFEEDCFGFKIEVIDETEKNKHL